MRSPRPFGGVEVEGRLRGLRTRFYPGPDLPKWTWAILDGPYHAYLGAGDRPMSAGALAELARAVESGGLHCPLTIEHPLARAAEIPAELALRAGVRVILVVDDVPAWVAAPGAADVEVKLDGRPRRREAAVSTGWQYVSLAYADDEE